MAIFHFVAFCCSSKIWLRSIISCRYSRRVCFVSKILVYLIKIKMLSCLHHDTAHVCLFDKSYISYYLHMLSSSNWLRFPMEWLFFRDLESCFTRKTKFVSHTFSSLNLPLRSKFPGKLWPVKSKFTRKPRLWSPNFSLHRVVVSFVVE